MKNKILIFTLIHLVIISLVSLGTNLYIKNKYNLSLDCTKEIEHEKKYQDLSIKYTDAYERVNEINSSLEPSDGFYYVEGKTKLNSKIVMKVKQNEIIPGLFCYGVGYYNQDIQNHKYGEFILPAYTKETDCILTKEICNELKSSYVTVLDTIDLSECDKYE